ncbi:hypothetical protein IWW37_005679 [Coemansia sp. RSA 2050]|nr:hypothetical protein IWW37_005679 [Coemansia sp. RSA 2050]KAJ2729313.1 hypothetical protein IW152_005677 [Coemansia sp. BCRC 34962]
MFRIALGRTTTRFGSRVLPLRAHELPRPLTARLLHVTVPSQTMAGLDENHPFYKQAKQNPRLLAAMASTLQLVQSKGYIDPVNPKPPSLAKMMQIMSDSDIRKAFAEVKKLMDEEGINFSPEELSALMRGFAENNSSTARDDLNTADGAKDGLFRRIASSIKSRS